MTPRQIWANPVSTSTTSYEPGCTPVVLPSYGMCSLHPMPVVSF